MEDRNSDYNINELFAYQMLSPYWDIEEYEDEDLDLYNIIIDSNGIPIFINLTTFEDDIPIYRSFMEQYNSKKGIFVLTMDGILRMGYNLHHSDLTAGHPVLCAGEFKLNKDGAIKSISNKSGHFVPRTDCLEDVISIIYANGYSEAIKIKYYN